MQAIVTKAATLYTTFGGTQPKPISLSLATGDGTTTAGRNGKDNQGIAFNRYGNTSGFTGTSTSSVTGMDQARVTFQPSSPEKPMTINIVPSGANSNETNAKAKTGNRVNVEYRDQNGNTKSIEFATFQDPVTKLTRMTPIPDPNIKFDANTGTLTFPKPGSKPISVAQRSDLNSKDEIFANLTITGAIEVQNNEVDIALLDYFKPNQWDVDITKFPDFQANTREVVALRKADHVPDLKADVQGHGAGALANGEVVKRKGGATTAAAVMRTTAQRPANSPPALFRTVLRLEYRPDRGRFLHRSNPRHPRRQRLRRPGGHDAAKRPETDGERHPQ